MTVIGSFVFSQARRDESSQTRLPSLHSRMIGYSEIGIECAGNAVGEKARTTNRSAERSVLNVLGPHRGQRRGAMS